MKRSFLIAVVCIGMVTSPAWALLLKGKKKEQTPFGPRQQQYLDDSFEGLSAKLKALETQVAALSQTLQTLEQNQTQLQSALEHQNQTLQDLENKVGSLQLAGDTNSINVNSALQAMRNSDETSFRNLRDAIVALQAQQQNLQPAPTSSRRGGSRPAEDSSNVAPTPTAPSASPSSASPVATTGYISNVNGDVITINLGSSSGLSVGSKLGLFQANDSTFSSSIGVLEVTDIIDSSDAHVKVDQANSGVQPMFGDRVKLQ